jgi:hypothetical protein
LLCCFPSFRRAPPHCLWRLRNESERAATLRQGSELIRRHVQSFLEPDPVRMGSNELAREKHWRRTDDVQRALTCPLSDHLDSPVWRFSRLRLIAVCLLSACLPAARNTRSHQS